MDFEKATEWFWVQFKEEDSMFQGELLLGRGHLSSSKRTLHFFQDDATYDRFRRKTKYSRWYLVDCNHQKHFVTISRYDWSI